MKTKSIILFISALIIGYAVYFIANSLGVPFLINCLIQVFAITLLGDLIGKYILKLPLFNYANLISYLYERIIGSVGFLFVLCIIWGVMIAFLDWWQYDSMLLTLTIRASLIPSLYYIIINKNFFNNSHKDNKLLRRKLWPYYLHLKRSLLKAPSFFY